MKWQLTSYGADSQPTSVTNDTSFEELRWAQVQQPQSAWAGLHAPLLERSQQLLDGLQAPRQPASAPGQAKPPSGPFSSAAAATAQGTAPSPFASAVATSGAQSSSAAPSAAAATPTFGQAAAASPFASAAAAASPFGSTQAPASSPFGAALSGQTAAGTPPAASPFGSLAAPSGPFGSLAVPSGQGASTGASPFGSLAAPQATPFGRALSAAGSQPFRSHTVPGLAPLPAVKHEEIDLEPVVRAAFEALAFDKFAIPDVEPPPSVC